MAKLKIWNPWDLHDPFNKMFEGMGRNLPLYTEEDNSYSLITLNLWEDETNYVAEVPVPGMKPEQIEVAVEDRYLTISGKKEEESEDKNKRYHVRELSSIEFTRTVMLPGNVDSENVEAKCDNGILTIKLPKLTKSTTKKIAVK